MGLKIFTLKFLALLNLASLAGSVVVVVVVVDVVVDVVVNVFVVITVTDGKLLHKSITDNCHNR